MKNKKIQNEIENLAKSGKYDYDTELGKDWKENLHTLLLGEQYDHFEKMDRKIVQKSFFACGDCIGR
jgi:hypothetical protein